MAGSPKTFTKEEVAKHASEESCWIIIENKVYDVTNWLDTVSCPKGLTLTFEPFA